MKDNILQSFKRIGIFFFPCVFITFQNKLLKLKNDFHNQFKDKFKRAILSCPEIHEYFGKIHEICFININVFNNIPGYETEKTVEYLITGSKGLAKVYIKFSLVKRKSILINLEKQKEIYQKALLKNKLNKGKYKEETLLNDFKKNNFIHKFFNKKFPSYLEQITSENPEIKEIKEKMEIKNIEKKNFILKNLDFYLENLNDTIKFVYFTELFGNKINESFNLFDKLIGENEINTHSKGDLFLISLKNFINFEEKNIKTVIENEVVIKDILVKKGMKFYSVNPSIHSPNEFSSTDIFLSLENYESGTKLEEIENELFSRNFEKAVAKYLKYKLNLILNNYSEENKIIIDKNSPFKKRYEIDDEFEYNYSAVDEIIDYIKTDKLINYVVKIMPVCLIFLLINSLMFNNHKYLNFQLLIKNVEITSKINNLSKHPFYLALKYPYFLNNAHKFVFYQIEDSGKKVIRMNIDLNDYKGKFFINKVYDERNLKI